MRLSLREKKSAGFYFCCMLHTTKVVGKGGFDQFCDIISRKEVFIDVQRHGGNEVAARLWRYGPYMNIPGRCPCSFFFFNLKV